MVTVSVLEGGWIVFDQIRLEGADELVLEKNNEYAFLRNVAPAEYEMGNGMEQKYSLYWLM